MGLKWGSQSAECATNITLKMKPTRIDEDTLHIARADVGLGYLSQCNNSILESGGRENRVIRLRKLFL